MNHEIKEPTKLLNEAGLLKTPGYAKYPVFTYDRKEIAASKWRIKEWDYYACIHEDVAFAFTVADLGYLGMLTATKLDFKTNVETKKTIMTPFPFGKFQMPNSPEKGDVVIKGKHYEFRFGLTEEARSIKVKIKDFVKGKDLAVDLLLKRMKDERMVIATPWKEKPKAFYYNQKVNCMPTSGMIQLGDEVYFYDKLKHLSVLDWGRGVWTYKNTWYWSSMSVYLNGQRFGFNLGYGFGDTSKATENMLFYKGEAHKLGDVFFKPNPDDFMKPWIFTSPDKRVDLVMTPIFDRKDHTNLLIIQNFGHQVFGRFNGTVTLDDGTVLQIEDKIGFAEEITNHY
ncbi:MAG: DUF2804 domain-containing protein [Bacilli bacterium]|nr:DUF2804 domain-containing protein [Bacilli bacterium]MBN2876894.1 DUF2804 domain-containing protein [Bacilli bacterium]